MSYAVVATTVMWRASACILGQFHSIVFSSQWWLNKKKLLLASERVEHYKLGLNNGAYCVVIHSMCRMGDLL